MSEVTIQVTESGPLRIDGPTRLIDADGGQYELDPGQSAYLCRCGQSDSKPFCHGTHAKRGFAACERAPAR